MTVHPNRIATIAALGAAVVAAWLLVGEMTTLRIEQRLLDSSASAPTPAPQPPIDPGASPRALLADGALRIRTASALPAGPARTRLLDQAIGDFEATDGARPYWGEAKAATAFAYALRDGPAAPETLAAFRQSYADAPYLDRASRWRVSFGLANWRLLDAATRMRVLDETIWLARANQRSLDWVTPLVRASDGYRAFQRRWVETRRRDPGFDPR